ncbi:hypothetical protein LIER_42964 [Lithospermum erythrorhizon]|uniref:Reverse transcriptase Ty1/copia-type domain-containing protein n=1 Tax=Lithospermum erythrorhizon TaxID=34254 RepID=A0AAV3P7L3_LITER
MELLFYVDDILLVGNSRGDIQKVKKYLDDSFTIKDLGDAKFFLDIELFHTSAGIFLNQMKYTLDMLKDTGLIGLSWKTKQQATVSKSSTELEYKAMTVVVCELQWITYIMADLHMPVPKSIPLWRDNQAAIHITSNHVFHERTKHLKIDCQIVRNQYLTGFITPQHIASKL